MMTASQMSNSSSHKYALLWTMVAAVLAEAEGRGDREPPPITSFDHERLT